MQAGWQRWRWTVLLAALAAVGFSGLQLHGRLWEWWGVQPMRPPYVDLVAVLSAGEAHARGIDVYHRNPLDPYGRPHVYGPAWLWTGKIGLVTEDAWWAGTGLATIFIIAVAFLLAPRDAREALSGLPLLLSPPLVLGLERGNNDLVVFLLLLSAAWCVASPARAGGVAGAAQLVLSAALKFYPLACFAALLARRGPPLRRIALIGASLLGFVVLAWWQRDGITRALNLAPQPKTIFAYGLPVLNYLWSFLPTERVWILPGFLAVMLPGSLWLVRSRAALAAVLPAEGWRTAAVLGGGAAWLLCFVLVPSYPYRIALLLPAAAVAWQAGAAGGVRAFGWLLVAGCWLSTPKHWLAALTESAPQQTWPWHVVAALSAAEQGVFLLLSIALGIMLAGWSKRCWLSATQPSGTTAA